ncbi:hypothetical protein FP744_10002002 [Trichoderma asperellum]|nr:hypothetical protein LI328DRAFT_138740 [Trichoderma asperelloides]
MTAPRYQTAELRRQVGSPRPRPRENKDTLCRNILIYGHCRYEDQGCAFMHDQTKGNSSQASSSQQDNSGTKKTLNVESPSFTPSILQPVQKKPTFSSQAVTAPSFTPRGLGAATPSTIPDTEAPAFNPASIREFTPSFDLSSTTAATNGTSHDGGALSYDPFGLPNQSMVTTPYNPYAEDHGAMTSAASTYFAAQNAYAAPSQPLQYHLYAPVGPYREDIMPYNRLSHDFFISETMREDMQKQSEATWQVMPGSQLPHLDNYHSLVALDTTHRKNAGIFGYPSWVYKATSSKDGKVYCLRRLEGFRLTNEHAIRSVKEWRRINNCHVVSIHDAFTTRAFGDSSLIIVQDYHPLSKTLAETHLVPSVAHGSNRLQPKPPITEAVLWGYITQIASALKAIHGNNLSARCLDVSKIILTDKNRIRLTACSIIDVTQYDVKRPMQELQQEDLLHFGRTLLCLATNTLPMQMTNMNAAMEQMSRSYSTEMKDTIAWLLTPAQPPAQQKTIDEFIQGIATHITTTMDQQGHYHDTIRSELFRELENSRLLRLMMKLGTINERPEYDNDRAWSEIGERYMLKLFRDYVFHQVDGNGNPVIDPGHMIRCLNKLDAGSDENICLTSRDEQTSIIVSYKEVKKQVLSAFGDLLKGSSKTGRSF